MNLFLLMTIFTTAVISNSIASNKIVTPLGNLGDVVNDKISSVIQSKTITIVPDFPDSGRKKAVPETEDIISKFDNSYGRLQEFVGKFFNPKPVVDTIQEYEKYGNDGGSHRKASVAVIQAVEAGSNALNVAVEVPYVIATQLNKKVSKVLAPFASKLFIG